MRTSVAFCFVALLALSAEARAGGRLLHSESRAAASGNSQASATAHDDATATAVADASKGGAIARLQPDHMAPLHA